MNGQAGSDSDRLEDVAIEAVHVGDYICLDGGASSGYPSRPGLALCVLGKATTRGGPGDRVTGWRVELWSGATVWLPRGARVQRRRFGRGRTADPHA